MKETVHTRNKLAFTLIELLVVAALIMLLVGITMPMMNRAIENTRISRAQTEVNALEAAFRAYYNSYSIWPTALGGTDPDGTETTADVVRMLSGENVNEMNRRRIAFMEFPERSLRDDGAFVDAWDNPYRFVFDHNFDNTVQVGLPEVGGTLHRRAAVWSLGPQGEGDPYITSWGS